MTQPPYDKLANAHCFSDYEGTDRFAKLGTLKEDCLSLYRLMIKTISNSKCKPSPTNDSTVTKTLFCPGGEVEYEEHIDSKKGTTVILPTTMRISSVDLFDYSVTTFNIHYSQ